MSDKDLRSMLTTLCAESKVTHQEVQERLSKMENRLRSLVKSNKRSGSSGGGGAEEDAECDVIDVGDELLTSDEDHDLDKRFCVDLPAQSYEEFLMLEAELENSPAKCKLMVSSYRKCKKG